MKQLLAKSIAPLVMLTVLGAATAVRAAAPADGPPPATVAAPVPTPPGAAKPADAAALPPDPVADDASSYAVGLNFGVQLKGGGIDHAVILDSLVRGIKDAIAGHAPTEAEKQQARQLVFVGRTALTEHNRREAREFLARNGKIPGVVTTASGLQYQIFEAGNATAAAMTQTDRVTINYRGRLIDGTEFDNSDRHDQAAAFTVGGVIKGWHEALLLMKPGAKWRLFVPPDLAYGAFPPPTIPPGALLIFDMELLKVESAGAANQQDNAAHAPARKPRTLPAKPAAPAPAQH
jgi:FKBP-type peptidyl-prolyl cis-trans isomerase FklB